MPTFRDYYDMRDGQIYPCVLMPDGKWWMSKNYAWAGAGGVYENNESNRAVYGGLYSWDSAVSSPQGCHLGSIFEFYSMLDSVIGESYPYSTTGKYLKSPSWIGNPGLDTLGFSALPSGFNNGGWVDINYITYFWSSTVTGGDAALSETMWLGYDSDRAFTNARPKTDMMSVRYIVDTFVDPPSASLFGAPFSGFERGLSCKLKRQILVDDSEGGSVTLTPVAPVAFDEWEIEAEFWVPDAYAQQIEACVPPRGTPLEQAIRLPPRNGEASFPGLLPYQSTADYDLYSTPQVTALESLGRKGPRMNLIGYRIAFSFFAETDGLALNASPTPTTAPPAWLSGKFAAHQIQDWSNQREVVAATTLAGHPSPRGSFYPVRHGRRRDVSFNLDHLSTARANELVALFRGVRHNAVTITLDRGPEGLVATSVYLTELDLQRGAGLWWDGTLKAVLA